MGSTLSNIDYDEEIQKAIVINPSTNLKYTEDFESSKIVTATPYVPDNKKLRKREKKSAKEKLKEENRKSTRISKQLRKDQKENQSRLRILFLGLRNSGKTSIIKQAVLSSGKSCPETFEFDAKLARIDMYRTIFKGLSKLAQIASRRTNLGDELLKIKEKLLLLEDTKRATFDSDIGDMAFRFWCDKGIREIWNDVRKDVEEEQNLVHYMANKKIFSEDYKMTVNDWLHARDYSRGAVEYPVTFHGIHILLQEFGYGIATDNRKLLRLHFDKHMVTFVVDTQDYDKEAYSNQGCSRLLDALDYFESIANDPHLNTDSMLLFLLLNKTDLLLEKLRTKPLLKSEWPDFEHAVDEDRTAEHISKMSKKSDLEKYVQNALVYFEKKFLDRLKNPDKQHIYVHATSMSDKNVMENILSGCAELILQNNMTLAGILP